MPDLTNEILPQIKNHRINGFEFGGHAVYPDYQGGSILNLPPSICQMFKVPMLGESPLRAEYLLPLGDDPQTVVMILMDALSFDRFERWSLNGTAPVWQKLIERGVLTPMTSITPSTTCAVLTSLWTGQSPATHGIVGYEGWLKEYGVVANLILHKPITFQGDNGGLSRAGFDVDTFLTGTRLGTHLVEHGIQTYAFLSRHIADSGLSRMHLKDTIIEEFSTPAELWVNVRKLIENQAGVRKFIWIYWGEVDHYSHFYGPDDERVSAEFVSFSNAFEHNFMQRIPQGALKDLVLILTADHGMVHTPNKTNHDIRQHPDLDRCLHILTGENRIIYLYIRPGCVDAVEQYFQKTFPDQFDLLNPKNVVEQGLFGPGPIHPRLFDRLGDMIAIARDDAYLWWSKKENFMLGRHGGLHPDEMIVPFMAVKW
jgi:predicted AlkP superfamily pyrophosphatase or phosphodiesterase